MKKNVLIAGICGSLLMMGALDCQAEKWEKNDLTNRSIESGYYDADSIKVQGNTVSWTEKYIYSSEGAKAIEGLISKHKACKDNLAKKGGLGQFQLDYQIKTAKYEGKAKIRKTHELLYRGVAVRYYNKSNELICTDKDMGTEFDTSWHKVGRNSPIENAYYDLVTKYKVKLPME